MQKTASETMKPPAASRAGGAYVSGQSCCPPRRSAGKRCWWSAIPSGMALTGGMRPRGAPGPMIAPGLRSSRLRLRINGRGPNQGPHRAQPAPTSSAYKKNQKKEKPSPQPQKGRRERPAEAPGQSHDAARPGRRVVPCGQPLTGLSIGGAPPDQDRKKGITWTERKQSPRRSRL